MPQAAELLNIPDHPSTGRLIQSDRWNKPTITMP